METEDVKGDNRHKKEQLIGNIRGTHKRQLKSREDLLTFFFLA
jgi:hypothetical protein